MTLSFLFWLGCTPATEFESGSYIPDEDGPEELTGLNLTLSSMSAFFVMEEEVASRTVMPIAKEELELGCDESVLEDSMVVEGDAIPLSDGDLVDVVLYADCEVEGRIRLSSADREDLFLSPL